MAKTAKFKILKNQPMPPNGTIVYPFAEMEVGDCVHFPVADRAKVDMAANRWARRHGLKFVTRKIDEKTLGVWRVS